MPSNNPLSKQIDIPSKNLWQLILPECAAEGEPGSFEIISMIRNGIPGVTISRIALVLEMSESELCRLLKVSSKTRNKLASMKLSHYQSDQIVRIIKTSSRAIDVFGSRKSAFGWLKSSCIALGNQIPLELLDTVEGSGLVMDTLGRIEYGVFA